VELDIDTVLVRRLLAAQFPRWAELPIQPVTSAGTVNALYRLGDDMAVRLPRVEWAVKDVDRERRWLPRLAPLLPVAIPSGPGPGRSSSRCTGSGRPTGHPPTVECRWPPTAIRSWRGYLLPAGAREVFRAIVGVDEATWARGRGWALSMALVQLPYYQDTNPLVAADARRAQPPPGCPDRAGRRRRSRWRRARARTLRSPPRGPALARTLRIVPARAPPGRPAGRWIPRQEQSGFDRSPAHPRSPQAPATRTKGFAG
jgi:hypothetical protein